MTADEMFEELGFDYFDNYNHDYIYGGRLLKREKYEEPLEQRIVIDCDTQTVEIDHGTPDIFPIINKKIDELGMKEIRKEENERS